jgi:DNA-3-methyladenine glycosylase I
MVEKLRQLSKGDAFVRTMEENKSFNYIEKKDSYFFEKMAQAVFESGLRAWAWEPHKEGIKKAFCYFDVRKVAGFDNEEVERILVSNDMIRRKPKIEAVVYDAGKIVEISEKHNGFWKWIDNEVIRKGELIFPKPEFIEEIQKTFKWLTGINAYYFLKLCGVDVIKPDLNVRRILFRLGLTESEKNNRKTWNQIQEVGRRISKATGERIINIDYVIYLYGSGGVQFFDHPICTKKPKCEECPLTNFCYWYRKEIDNEEKIRKAI